MRKQITNEEEIQVMYQKIKASAQMYSSDLQTMGLFWINVMRNFARVFVISCKLYDQARNLQLLNTYLLKELTQWDKQINEKNMQLQDLTQHLATEIKLKLFFIEKSIKAEQKALRQQKIKNICQYKSKQMQEKLQKEQNSKEKLNQELQNTILQLSNLSTKNQNLKIAFENKKQKYSKLIQQLTLLKTNLINLNEL